ncbi:MAG: PCRF domain-containing protein, partial [Oscillospiraceae bacterium]|nr:PCRF domain-containing protein [Oscillospiraceae bacterium]
MLDKLKFVEEKYIELCARCEQPDFYADPKKAAAYLKEQRDLEPVVTAYRGYLRAKQDMQDALELMSGQNDPEMKELCQEEFSAAKKRSEELEQELKILLLPKDPNDEKSVIMEIRGGVGGEESALFAHSLFRMYNLYAASRGWSVELLNYSETELG